MRPTSFIPPSSLPYERNTICRVMDYNWSKKTGSGRM
jgi:hypothetical protein